MGCYLTHRFRKIHEPRPNPTVIDIMPLNASSNVDNGIMTTSGYHCNKSVPIRKIDSVGDWRLVEVRVSRAKFDLILL